MCMHEFYQARRKCESRAFSPIFRMTRKPFFHFVWKETSKADYTFSLMADWQLLTFSAGLIKFAHAHLCSLHLPTRRHCPGLIFVCETNSGQILFWMPLVYSLIIWGKHMSVDHSFLCLWRTSMKQWTVPLYPHMDLDSTYYCQGVRDKSNFSCISTVIILWWDWDLLFQASNSSSLWFLQH